MGLAWACVCTGIGARTVQAQETVFDVPSADVLDKGKVYYEQDGTVRGSDPSATFTPRIIVGIGHGIEVGMNFNGLGAPTWGELNVSPTIKWTVWKGKEKRAGWSMYVGDNLYFPVYRRSYNAANYVYAMIIREWSHGTRVGAGGYDFTKNVVAAANRAGGQFTIEQVVNDRVTLAAEWYTGNHAEGYFNPGVIFKLTKKWTLFAAYQIGNAGVSIGNHQFLYEIGYNFN